MFEKKEFSALFEVDEIISSNASSNRKNAAQLKILAIEDEFVRYQPLLSSSKSRMKYSYLRLLLDGYEKLDPRSIQKSVKTVLAEGGFVADYSTKNYAYIFAQAFRERAKPIHVLSQGETAASTLESQNENYVEGRRFAVLVERIERDPDARERCISHFGVRCAVCQFDFEERYGALGKGFIHVHHHRVQLASTSGAHNIDPVEDLVPLCPNCHAMIHRQAKMLSVKELKQLINKSV